MAYREFDWDDAKNAETLRLRGFDFDRVSQIFRGPVIETDDERFDYGERRIQAVGRIDKEIFFVVYTWRGSIRRIISARRASREERDDYRAEFG